MIKNALADAILANFPHEPTREQREAASMWGDFLTSTSVDDIFLLTGYAGTGKTSLVGALVKTLRRMETPTMLLAPTGRAAKVFSLYASSPASTIHRKIYRQKEFSPELNNFVQGFNPYKDMVFIVDEASMIANEAGSNSTFGSGCLLDDLIQYVYSGRGCRLILVGDTAQLPPVGETLSPALNEGALLSYGHRVRPHTLTEVVRQVEHSGILWNATALRNIISAGVVQSFPRIKAEGFTDVRVLPGGELIEALEDSYSRVGREETIVVTRSNKRAVTYNNGIRKSILDYEEPLVPGDQLIVAKNNYYWTEKTKSTMSFVANGDICEVVRIRNERMLYGFHFVDAILRFPDYDDEVLNLTMMLDTLQTEVPALPPNRQRELFDKVSEDYSHLHNRRKQWAKVKEDKYFNALQVKYAYAVTCHKAQGGQWRHVYIDQGLLTPDMLSPEYYRWLYTAFTRATERVYLVNWPPQQIMQS